MVGHLVLREMDAQFEAKRLHRGRDGGLDSPDSGLPPSPSPPLHSASPGAWSPSTGSRGPSAASSGSSCGAGLLQRAVPGRQKSLGSEALRTRSFSEGVEVEPPPSVLEVRCVSELQVGSARRYRSALLAWPGLGRPTSHAQTLVLTAGSTWRHHRSEVLLEARPTACRRSYADTHFVFPGGATRRSFTTTLTYGPDPAASPRRRYLSCVQLQPAARP
ncbi:refilin-A [Petromyzon marinus]|uniref:Refilin-A n=1 Tax=Petromyzon marinus TaxID=7757 RepID=A0AAJ7X779_PETMA|nr:refilin-A [Petromyzon marinus]